MFGYQTGEDLPIFLIDTKRMEQKVVLALDIAIRSWR
jgi:hypothetical protein